MAQLFSKGKIKQEVAAVAGLDITDKIAIVQKLHAEWKNGNADDETRYEQNFNQLFFNELLGYTRNDHMHPKAGTPVGGKIADLGLGLFAEGKYNFDDVQVVVELKGAKIFLDKKQNRQNPQSPVDQGFGYKTSFTKCKWLIVSNFHQVRLYRDNKQDYQEWTLAELASGQDNWFALRSLLVLLSANRLLSRGGESHTEKLMSQFRIEQQKITKKFYQEYKGLRLDLINDIRQNNPDLDIETVVEKAQKIIDRIVFVHFCEDKGLLPADKLKEVIDYGEKALAPVWQTLSNFFEAVNSGSEKLEIPKGYNGGLFKTDPALNALRVGDGICKKFVAMGDYDFDDELSVNILGHIFEQSISDLEQLKEELVYTTSSGAEQGGVERSHSDIGDPSTSRYADAIEDRSVGMTKDKKQSKRKKDGIFYTPEYIVDYIVQNSLMKYLSEKEDECLAKYKDEKKAYQAYQQILQHVKVLDPACGSGAFLVKVFDVLYAENQRVGILIGGLFDETETYKNILTNNIYGVDLNPESVEITKLSLWLKSAQKGKKLNNLDKNIKCGNSLIDDPVVAGERAFDWKNEFKVIMDAGGFDVIVGNPPYVSYYSRQSQSDSTTKDQLSWYIQNYDFIKDKSGTGGRYNTVMFFLEKIIKLTKEGGECGLIVDNNLHSNPFVGIRKYLLEHISLHTIVDELDVFEGVASTQVICIWNNIQSGKKHKFNYVEMDAVNNEVQSSKFQFDVLHDPLYDLRYFEKNSIVDKLDLIDNLENSLGKNNISCCISFTGKKDDFVFESKDNNIYHPLLEGSSGVPSPYSGVYYDKFVKYDLDLVKKLNNDYKILAEKENKRSAKAIYFPSNTNKFEAPKIFVRLSDSRVTATFTNDFVCGDLSLYIITLDNLKISNENFHLYYLLSLINSSLVTYYFIQKGRIRNLGRGTPQIRIKDLRQMPIKKLSIKEQEPFIEKVDQMLALNKEFHDKKLSALNLLQAEYGIEKINRKLEIFWELDFADFLKALGVKSLSLDKKEELMSWFGKKKEELASLQATIDQTDREIDGMVYGLYGLSEEEVRIVEGE